MNLLPSHRGRSTAGIAISVILHSLAAIVAVHAIAAAPHPKIGRPAFVLTFLGAPPVVPALPARLLRVPEAARARPPDISTPLSTPTPPAVTPAPETAGVEPKPAIPPAPPRSDPPPNSAPPRPSLAPITVGLFAGATNNSQNSAPGRRVVESAGFDAAPARAPETNLVAATSVGAFGAATAAPRPGTDRPVGSVADAGFGGAAAPISPSVRARAVADAGFGTGAEGESARAETPSRKEVRSGGFDILPAHVPQRGARPGPGPVDVPVEILFKPTPGYTDEARALKLEGDVILDVEFSASQDIRVLRVVRGLGHGLDEAAARAAGQIRFKPAQRGGKPVDFRATLHIVFRLT